MADDGWEHTVTRAFIGTGQTVGRVRWIWETEKGRVRLGQIIGRTLATGFGLWSAYALGTHWPWVGVVELIGLLWYGHAKAQLEEADPDAELDEGDQAEAEPDEYDVPEQESAPVPVAPPVAPRPMPSPAETRELIINSVRHLAGQRQGVHLEQLHAVWTLEGLQMDLSEFRRWVEAHGVPVRNSLKASGATRIGVHLDDLPTGPPATAPATPPPVVPDDLLQDW